MPVSEFTTLSALIAKFVFIEEKRGFTLVVIKLVKVSISLQEETTLPANFDVSAESVTVSPITEATTVT